MTARGLKSRSLIAPSGISGLSAYAITAARTNSKTATKGRATISSMRDS